MTAAILVKGQNVGKGRRSMSREFMTNNGYYAYQGPPQYFYQGPDMYQGNPNMRQGQQYVDWQGYPAQQYYQEYSPQEYQQYNYGGYGNYGQGYGVMQDQENFYNSQDTSGQGNQNQSRTQSNRSKHSYSQNRNRNRQRPEQRLQNDATAAVNTENSNTNNNAGAIDIGNTNADTKEEDNVKNTGENHYSSNRDDRSNSTYDRGRNRGGRFQGNDTRSRPFDRSQQNIDRQRKYNKQAPSDDARNKSNQNDSSLNDASSKNESVGAKSRSYRDNRGSAASKNRHEKDDSRSRGYRSRSENDRSDNQVAKNTSQNEEGGQGQRQRSDAEEATIVDASNENFDSADSLKDRAGGLRRKKKEIKLFSSSSHRDWPGSRSVTYSPQEASDRYNYRGQDYNKRHKEVSSPGIERGGDRTKLSNFPDKNDNKDEGDNDEENTQRGDVKGNSGPKRANKFGGTNRGSRYKPKGKVDESQRGSLIEQLTRGTYECMVCCEIVRTQNAVWSCSNCYHIFHLRCIKKWARSPNAVVSGADKDGWRCPACQNLTFKFPNQYRCFCGKMRDPDVSRLETPHSCGDVCQKERGEGCKHPCNILCHPGPCPECSAIVTKSCDCGKTKQTVKCGQSSIIKCESTCERQLNCGKHFCQAQCHSGGCEKCEVVITQECLGKHETREVTCGSEMSFQESYSCLTVCSKQLDCGNHYCDKPCHLGDCDSCPLLPKNTTRCPCGGKRLDELPADPRTSCLDPIPTCEGTCNKRLECGPENQKHVCEQQCHEGPCGPCSGISMLTCRCLFMDKEFNCSDISKFVDETGRFLCDRRCNRKKQCGRHKCGEKCCIKEDHPCEMACGRKLSCGLHKCEEPCHRNNCPPCLMAGFDELTCYCGAEVLFPPVPCGTKPPECHRPCTRQHTCDHPVRHNCHSEESCPPCTELTQKMCMGNHVKRSNIPCHIKDISCGMKCSKKLSCGEHLCIRICHKGDCIEEEQGCQQPCPRKRELCDHPCGLPCHGEQPCPSSVCKAKVIVKCACGHRRAEVICSVGIAMDTSNYQKIAMGATTVSIDTFRHGQTQVLECNKECALIERNRRVAEALDIQNPDLLPKFGSYSYTDFLKDQARQNAHFVAGIEKDFSDLVQSANKSKQPSRSHAFPCMNNNSRRVIHELAESYGIETQSYDYEPKKNVVATAKKDKCWVPSVTLTVMVQRESHPRAPPPIPHVFREETLRQNNVASKQSTSLMGDSPALAEGWQVIGKKTKKANTPSAKSAIATIDKFEGSLAEVCSAGKIDYAALSRESKEALKSEPVVDYFDFTVT